MWHDTHERFKINEQGCYATGFSGGSGMSFWMAEAHPDNVSGVIPLAVASTWAQGELDLPKHVSVFFIIGDKDAVPYVQKHVQSLRAKGNSAEMKTFSGGHQLPPATHTAAAIDWLQMIATEKIPLEMAENAEKLIAEKSPYEAREIYNEIVKKYPKSESAKKAKDKMKAMDADQSLSDELKAGALLAQGADAQKKGKIDDALKLFRQVETDYPKTEYVKRAKARADELEAEKLLKQAEELEGKGDKAAAGEIYKQILEKFPSTKSAEKAKEKAPK
jgi:tetratricopeptide (TPR) repeat protein